MLIIGNTHTHTHTILPIINSCHLFLSFFESNSLCWQLGMGNKAADSEGANPGHRRRPRATCVFVYLPVNLYDLEFVDRVPWPSSRLYRLYRSPRGFRIELRNAEKVLWNRCKWLQTQTCATPWELSRQPGLAKRHRNNVLVSMS